MPGMMGGMGGMFGGMMGGGGRGGMFGGGIGGGNPTNMPADRTSDVYDVDRWKRADDVDSVPLTHVQQVRDAWEREAKEKKHRSPLEKLRNLFHKRRDKAPAAEALPSGGTTVTPEMKRASARIGSSAAAPPPVSPPLPLDGEYYPSGWGKNYLGLSMVTELDDFFTMNPLNSAILAVDSLSFGPLTLNQVLSPEPETEHASAPSMEVPAESAVVFVPPAKPQEDDEPIQLIPIQQTSGPPSVGGERQNYIAQQSGTTYMNAIRESHEKKKYNVRIT